MMLKLGDIFILNPIQARGVFRDPPKVFVYNF